MYLPAFQIRHTETSVSGAGRSTVWFDSVIEALMHQALLGVKEKSGDVLTHCHLEKHVSSCLTSKAETLTATVSY